MKTQQSIFRNLLLLLTLYFIGIAADASAFNFKIRMKAGALPRPNARVIVTNLSPMGLSFAGYTNASGWATIPFENQPGTNGSNSYEILYFSYSSNYPNTPNGVRRDTLQVSDTNTLDVVKEYVVADEEGCRPEFIFGLVVANSPFGFFRYRFEPDTSFRTRVCFHSTNQGIFEAGSLRAIWTIDGVNVDTIISGGLKDTSNILKYNITYSGPHSVCLTVTDLNTGFTSTNCQEFEIPTPDYAYVNGWIFEEGLVSQDSIKVELIGQSNNVYRTTYTTINPDSLQHHNYTFLGVPRGRYIVRAVPIGPILSPLYAPTYSDSSLLWLDADTFHMRFVQVNYQNIHLRKMYVAPGLPRPGIVQGYFSGIGTTCLSVIPNLGVPRSILYQSEKVIVYIVDNQGRPIATTTVNPDGTFFLDNLPIGEYTLRTDHPLIDDQPIPVAFTVASPAMVVQVVVTAFGTNFITKTRELKELAEIDVYPNPTSDKVTLPGFETITSLEVSTASGKTRSIEPTFEIDLSSFPKGMYFLKGKTHSGQPFQTKIVKN